jgi:hypothetical protein
MTIVTTKDATIAIENPLWDCEPPSVKARGVDANLDILRQASEIKRILKRIATEDPLARSHQFAFRFYPENEGVLRRKGFTVNWEAPYTKVSWSPEHSAAAAVHVNVI